MGDRTLDIAGIEERIPHRHPLLLLDQVRDIEPGESAVGIKHVTGDDFFFQGHFPGRPIMPGVLVVEALAQTAAVLVAISLDLRGDDTDIYFLSVEEARFRKPVLPSTELALHVQRLQARRQVWRFSGEAKVDETVVANCRFTAMFNMRESAGAG